MVQKYSEGNSVQVKKTVNTAYAGVVGTVEVCVEIIPMYAVRFSNGDLLAFLEDELTPVKE